MSETIEEKTNRLLNEGRVYPVECETYAVEGDHGFYLVVRIIRSELWSCTCEASVTCSHIYAAQKLRDQNPPI